MKLCNSKQTVYAWAGGRSVDCYGEEERMYVDRVLVRVGSYTKGGTIMS